MKRIGIIGYGNMGSAIAERIKSRYAVYVFDKDINKTKNLSGMKVASDTVDLVKRAGVIMLAVKPQDFETVLNEIKNFIYGKLIISIAAGIRTTYIEKILGKTRVIRAMPNIGVKIGEAETSLCKGNNANDKDLDFTKRLFSLLGKTWVMKEEMIDAATAISGSGPAYIFNDMEIRGIDPHNIPPELEQEYVKRLKEAAERVGFNPQIAFDLATSTSATSLHLSAVSDKSLSELKKLVSSKGGTTEAALKIISENGNWSDAALAAKKRAEELSKN